MEDQKNTTGKHNGDADSTTKIILVDDHEPTREALAERVAEHPNWVVATEASSGEEAIESITRHPPDIVAMDMHMPGMNGIETTIEIVKKDPSIKVLIVSNYADPSLVKAAFQAGAMGYISKQAAFEELIPGIEAVVAGKQYVCGIIKQQLGCCVEW